jgi:hypothetical protein
MHLILVKQYRLKYLSKGEEERLMWSSLLFPFILTQTIQNFILFFGSNFLAIF